MKSNFLVLLALLALAVPILAGSFKSTGSVEADFEALLKTLKTESNPTVSQIPSAHNEIHEALTNGYKHENHPFGVTHLKKETEHGFDSIVHFKEGGVMSKEEHHKDLQDSFRRAEATHEQRQHMIDNAYWECENDDRPKFLKMSPLHVGGLNKKNSTFNWKAPCFQETTVTLNFVDEHTIEILHRAAHPKNLFCTDAFFYSSLSNHHVEVISRRGLHKITLKVDEKQYKEIAEVGLHVFRVCDKTVHFFPDLIKSIMMFIGGFGLDPNIPFFGSNTTEAEMKRNVEFLAEAWGVEYKTRPNVVVELDESKIQSGDFFAVIRFDGLDSIIGYGSGSRAGHSTMALRVDGQLYIVESQSGWYWPRTGIQMNPYKTWVKWARNAGFHVTHLPLKKEIAAKFDEKKALEYFRTIEGIPYGIHNFMWGWIDTADHSYPKMLSPEFIAPAFAIVEQISPIAARDVFNMALNKRLGTKDLKVAEIAYEANKRGLRMQDLYAMVEEDGWEYPEGVSYVCSAFVAAMYKAAGLFGDVKVNAVEFTPRDVYQLDFFDTKPELQENCKKVDPENHLCQIMGGYRMEFPGHGTIAIYDHMNERCYSEDPHYERFPQGC